VAARDPGLNVVLPNYGFGRSPVYLSGQLRWYGPGSQTAFLLVDPTYSGQLSISGVGTKSTEELSFAGPQTNQGRIYLESSVPSTTWRVWIGALLLSGPGCFAIRIVGTGEEEDIVLSVLQGPPPAD
jgi:hypothetical protein